MIHHDQECYLRTEAGHTCTCEEEENHVKGTDNALYNVDREAAILARDMARLRPRLRMLEKNLDHPRHAELALKFLDMALQEVAEI